MRTCLSTKCRLVTKSKQFGTQNEKKNCTISMCGHYNKLQVHYHTKPHFDALKIDSCGKHARKRKNCL